ncbi:hypothetical protein [Salinicoccus sp. HZC-1]|uniref:hypothetical protein n=1 Tax=Salinicoccus sp. HZC-1 TaxID=3385497 RepID=UPI00398A8D76
MLVKDIETRHSYIFMHQSMQSDCINDSHSINMNDWTLFYSEDLDVTVHEKGANSIVVLGYMLDIRDGDLTTEKIAKKLGQTNNIDNELNYINGRYVVILNKNNGLYVYTDASALMPINYSQTDKVISSHDILIKEILEHNGKTINPVQEELLGSFDFTRYQEIFKFNPSLKLNLKDNTFERYYPITEIKRKSIEDILKELDLYFGEMIKWLKKWDNDIILTLTGGYDSRVSMALTNELSGRIEYVTYLHPNLKRLSEVAKKIYEVDIFITEALEKNFRINRTQVNLADYNLKGEEREYYKNILQTAHSFPLIDYFKNERKFKKALHIKSTVFGMGKSDFPLNKNHNPETYKEMGEFIHGVSNDALKLSNYSDILTDYYKRNLQSENVGKGRHFFEIFHLESRMGNWHSNVTQETDPELLEFIFVNARRILDLLQSPSIQERRDKVLYKNIINKYWPALLFVGFNEKAFNLDYDKLGIDTTKYFNGLKIYEHTNLLITEMNENTVEIKPDKEEVGPEFQYIFKTKNKTNDSQKLTLKSLFNKENARQYINVSIMKLNEKSLISMDIVDLFKGYDITLEPFEEFMIEINYNHRFDKSSWQQAGRIEISIL